MTEKQYMRREYLREYGRIWRRANRGSIKARQRAWYLANRERVIKKVMAGRGKRNEQTQNSNKNL